MFGVAFALQNIRSVGYLARKYMAVIATTQVHAIQTVWGNKKTHSPFQPAIFGIVVVFGSNRLSAYPAAELSIAGMKLKATSGYRRQL